jgi:hypothetical protein
MEGWFRWRAGTTVLRDSTDMGGEGWMPAFASEGNLAYRLGGSGFNTGKPIDTVRNGQWHHIVATKSGTAAALYVDGQLVHSSPTGAGSQLATGPWHVMRNGDNAVFSEGEADEVALYTRALSASEVKSHFDLANDLADDPPPAGPSANPGAEPPLAGTGPGGGVLGPGNPLTSPRRPAGTARLRRGTLIVRGARGVRNDLIARKRGRNWIVRDRRARLRAGRGCRQLSPRAVRCPGRRVRRIALYGGAGNDRLTVIGRIPSRLIGGPGVDRTRRLSG